jgi:hypothetical protein
MNEQTAILKEVKLIPPHCSARTPSGRRSRMAISDPASGLCLRHAAVRLKENSGDFSEALVCGIKEFQSAVDINHVLGELYKLLAANKISPRRGAVMAYTCSLLLRTLPAIDEEPSDERQLFFFDLPRPKRDDDISPERAFVNRMSELHTRIAAPSSPMATTDGLPSRSKPNDLRSQSEFRVTPLWRVEYRNFRYMK